MIGVKFIKKKKKTKKEGVARSQPGVARSHP
jgi:hypothetical protein